MSGDIDRREKALAFTPKIYRFVAESRERRETAQDADENQRARFSRKETARLSKL